MERVTGIEPALPDWKSGALPLSYTREGLGTLALRCRDDDASWGVAVRSVPDGVQVQRHVLTGPASALAEGLAQYRELGVGDISLVLGHDDASARRTLDVLAADVLPKL